MPIRVPAPKSWTGTLLPTNVMDSRALDGTVLAPTIAGPIQVNSITLRVSISGGAGATSWTLQKSTDGGTTWTSAGSVTVGATQADVAVTTGQSTRIRIAATNGTTAYSNEVTGTTSEGGGATIVFQSALDSFDGWASVGSAWSIQTDGGGAFARCAYNGANTGPYQLRGNFPTQGLRELFMAFDIRQSVTTVSPKLLKCFGINDGGNFSNVTCNNQYGGAYAGIAYGNDVSGGNDSTCSQRYDNGWSPDARSPVNVVYRRGIAMPVTTAWRRFFFHWKQNSNGSTPDGEAQVWLDSFDGDGKQLWLDVRSLYNRGDNSPGFSHFIFGDYTATNTPFNFDLRNVALAHDAMPD